MILLLLGAMGAMRVTESSRSFHKLVLSESGCSRHPRASRMQIEGVSAITHRVLLEGGLLQTQALEACS